MKDPSGVLIRQMLGVELSQTERLWVLGFSALGASVLQVRMSSIPAFHKFLARWLSVLSRMLLASEVKARVRLLHLCTCLVECQGKNRIRWSHPCRISDVALACLSTMPSAGLNLWADRDIEVLCNGLYLSQARLRLKREVLGSLNSLAWAGGDYR